MAATLQATSNEITIRGSVDIVTVRASGVGGKEGEVGSTFAIAFAEAVVVPERASDD
jgi:hypothetical protein